jgi:hypothetical protein
MFVLISSGAFVLIVNAAQHFSGNRHGDGS